MRINIVSKILGLNNSGETSYSSVQQKKEPRNRHGCSGSGWFGPDDSKEPFSLVEFIKSLLPGNNH